MSIQFSTAVRNGEANAINTAIGASPTLKIWTAAAPATCATADSGTQLAHIALPATWLGAAANGAIAGSGLPWTENAADAAGTAGYFRIYDAGGTCHMQGSVTATGGGGDMTVSNTSFAAGQEFSVTGFTLTAGGA